jgi:prevent-host-death family protein
MCYICRVVAEVGLREMRQNASELVRRAEAGERLTVTVAGRPAAVLGPIASRRWRQWDEISDLFRTPVDAGLVQDLDRLDNHPRDPWATP